MNLRKRIMTLFAAAMFAAGMLVAVSATPAAASVGPADCNGSGGVFAGVASGNIQNGILNAVFCANGPKIVKAKVEYAKCCGGTVTLRFFWQIINTQETVALYTFWDNGAFTQSAGQTKWHAWTFALEFAPARTAQYPCYRGGMRDQNSLVYYITGKICP